MASSHEINDRLRLYNLSIRVGEGYRTSGTHPPVRPPLMVCRLSPFSSRNLLLCVWERVCVCVYDLQIKKKKKEKDRTEEKETSWREEGNCEKFEFSKIVESNMSWIFWNLFQSLSKISDSTICDPPCHMISTKIMDNFSLETEFPRSIYSFYCLVV